MSINERLLNITEKQVKESQTINMEPQPDIIGTAMANSLSTLTKSLQNLQDDMKHEAKINLIWNVVNTTIACLACLFAAIAIFK